MGAWSAVETVGSAAMSGAGYLVDKVGDGARAILPEAVTDTIGAGIEKVSQIGSNVVDKMSSGASFVVDKVTDAASTVGSKMAGAASTVVDAAKKVAKKVLPEKVYDGIGTVKDKTVDMFSWQNIKDKASGALSWTAQKAKDAFSWTKGKASDAISWVSDGASNVASKMQGLAKKYLPTKIYNGFAGAGGMVGNGFSWVKDKVSGGFSWVKDKVSEAFASIWSKIKGSADEVMSTASDWIHSKMKQFASWIWSKIESTWIGKTIKKVKHYAELAYKVFNCGKIMLKLCILRKMGFKGVFAYLFYKLVSFIKSNSTLHWLLTPIIAIFLVAEMKYEAHELCDGKSCCKDLNELHTSSLFDIIGTLLLHALPIGFAYHLLERASTFGCCCHKKSENNLKPDAQNKANPAVDGGAAQKESVGAGMEHGNTELVTDANAEQHQGHYVMRMLVIPLGIFTIGFHCFMLYSCLMIPWRMLFCTIGQIWTTSFIYHCSQDYLVGKEMKKEN